MKASWFAITVEATFRHSSASRHFRRRQTALGVIGRPLRFTRVQLEGLEVTVPPGGIDIDDTEGDDAPEHGTRDGDTASAESPLIVDDVRSERAILRLLRRRAHKQPRIFEIHHLSAQDAGSYDPRSFRATLTNPTPPGVIEARGTFGPGMPVSRR